VGAGILDRVVHRDLVIIRGVQARVEVRIPARQDSYPLAGELFLPDGEPSACVLIGSAMAVRARFYAPLARFVAEQGAAALTLDYRGMGGSRPAGSLRGFEAQFHHWGERDLAGAADFLGQRFPGKPLHFIGHSAGAQLMGLVEPKIRSALFIAAGSAYWKAYPGRARAFMAAFFHLIVPGVTLAAGYLPMSRFGQGDDVPRGVALEWARWGRDPRYAMSHAAPRGGLGYTTYAGPLRALSIADDSYAPRSAIEALLALYTSARKELRPVPAPQPIGHFGFFRQPALWPTEIAWLLSSS
jgi:predicted alpha/beta hydrolase